MSRRPAQFTTADINRIGEWAMKKGLTKIIVDMPSGVTITVPLDKDIEADDLVTNKTKYDGNFTI